MSKRIIYARLGDVSGTSGSAALVRRNPRLMLLFNIQSGFCPYCQQSMTLELGLPTTATLDHVVARSAGGPTDEGNLVAACYDCNRSKGSSPLEVFNPSARGEVGRILKASAQWGPFMGVFENPLLCSALLSFLINKEQYDLEHNPHDLTPS